MNAAAEFETLVVATLARFLVQNGGAASPVAAQAIARRLHALIGQRGLPRPLAPDEAGAPGGIPESEFAAMSAHVLDDVRDSLLVEAARQLIKACFYPEFRQCRDSYKLVSPDGECRRQQLGRARLRVSGAHCVDCPYWTTLSEERHRELLAADWHHGRDACAVHLDVFLPEDFRRLRQWLYREMRRGGSSVTDP